MKDCAQKAMTAALELVSRCCDVSVLNLESKYRMECNYGFFDEVISDKAGEDVLEQADANEEAAANNETEAVLQHLAEVAAEEYRSATVSHGDDGPDTTADPEPKAKDTDGDLEDGDDLIKLTDEQSSKEHTPLLDMELQIHTLRDALVVDRELFADLWRLSVTLRCGSMGMDSKFLKRAEVIRDRSRELNWHQNLWQVRSRISCCVSECF